MHSEEFQLWKDYAETLARQNQAKNIQREALNRQIELVSEENSHILRECSFKEHQLKSQKQYIQALEKQVRHADRAVYEVHKRKQQVLEEFQHLSRRSEMMEEEHRRMESELKMLQSNNQRYCHERKYSCGGNSSCSEIHSELNQIKSYLGRLCTAFEHSINKNKELVNKNSLYQERINKIQSLMGINLFSHEKQPHYLEQSKQSFATETQSYITLKPNPQQNRKSFLGECNSIPEDSGFTKQPLKERNHETPVKLLALSRSDAQVSDTDIKIPILRVRGSKRKQKYLNLTERENEQNVFKLANQGQKANSPKYTASIRN